MSYHIFGSNASIGGDDGIWGSSNRQMEGIAAGNSSGKYQENGIYFNTYSLENIANSNQLFLNR